MKKTIFFCDEQSPGNQWTATVGRRCKFDFVWCPLGTCLVGSPKGSGHSLEEPRQKLRLSEGFWIAQTPITRRQWQEIIGHPLSLLVQSSEGDLVPAEGITWDEARDFCRRFSDLLKKLILLSDDCTVDLPSEAQWEYACRAGTTSSWFFGNEPSQLENYAWYALNSGGCARPVASKRPNPWNIFDLYGNVAEWCLDEFRRYDDSEVIDPLVFNESGLMKIVRGGDYASTAQECRSASRSFCQRSNPYNEPTGLRPVIRKLG